MDSFSSSEVESFTAVLVDGSKELFLPDLINAGYHGGRRAATVMKESTRRYLQEQGLLGSPFHKDPVATFIYIYSDLQELVRRYARRGTNIALAKLSKFVLGFDSCLINGQAILADVDMDSKKDILNLLVNILVSDYRCLDIVVAESMKGATVDLVRSHENPIAILQKLRFTSFPEVFNSWGAQTFYRIGQNSILRRHHLQSTPGTDGSHGTRTLTAPSEIGAPVVAPVDGSEIGAPGVALVDATVRTVYAENRRANAESLLAAKGQPPNLRSLNNQNKALSSSDMAGSITRDGQGRRLDPPLNVDQSLVVKMEVERLCNNFHLKGYCSFGKCKHLHLVTDESTKEKRPLTATEEETLRFLARRSFCKNGTSCDDRDCYAGHRCPNHINKPMGGCSFPASMHFDVQEPIFSEKETCTRRLKPEITMP